MPDTSKHIAVLKGGWSAERAVSLVSGDKCAAALREAGYRVSEIDVGHNIAQALAELKPDVAFNALHGRFGEDGCIQGILEVLEIPYTHSGVLASSVAMDKPMAKRVFAGVGLRCPEGKTLNREELAKGDPIPRPYVIKPANEGSSVGVHIVTEQDNKSAAMIVEKDVHSAAYLAETYIPGRELTVAVLNGKALGVTEIRPHTGFFDYENKYTGGKTEHLLPAPVPPEVAEEAMRMAALAHEVLGCRGLSRSDFRYDDGKKGVEGLYLLELNTQPGMTPLSLSPEQAMHAGIDFPRLVSMLVEDAGLNR